MIGTLTTLCTTLVAQPAPVPQPAAAQAPPPKLNCRRVEQAPTLDGKADDAAWAKAMPIRITVARPLEPDKGASTTVDLRAVQTATHIHFLAEWDDATQDVSHKTWTWNVDTNGYEEGKDREDMFALAFQHTGEFNPDMLAGVESVWDVWHWKAFRTNPQGYAMDKTHRYTRSSSDAKSKEHQARDGRPVWISRPEDAGNTVEKKQPAPSSHQGDRVPQYVPGTPTGSAADVRAKGAWADGKWMLEFSRKLDTGSPDDTTFEAGQTYQLSVAAFDRTGNMDKASDLVELVIEGSR